MRCMGMDDVYRQCERYKLLSWKAGTEQDVATLGRVMMCFVRPWSKYKEVESDVEMEMKLIKGFGELICLPV